jgi:hypothetical protein
MFHEAEACFLFARPVRRDHDDGALMVHVARSNDRAAAMTLLIRTDGLGGDYPRSRRSGATNAVRSMDSTRGLPRTDARRLLVTVQAQAATLHPYGLAHT